MYYLDYFNQFNKYYCVLSGGYIYYYKKMDDVQYSFYSYIKKSKLMKNDKKDGLFTILLNSRYDRLTLGFEKEED